MEITSPVVETEDVVFEIVLLLLAFPLDYVWPQDLLVLSFL